MSADNQPSGPPDPRALIDAALERMLSALKGYNAAYTAAVRQGYITADTTIALEKITLGINKLINASAELQRSIKEPPARPPAREPTPPRPTRQP